MSTHSHSHPGQPYAYYHQVVNDLAWALSSPPLMCPRSSTSEWPAPGYYQQIFQQARPWLARLDKDPSVLQSLLAAQKDRRLGRYFETLWHFWLLNQHRLEIIDTSLQIIIDGETLGEMDFILFDKEQRCYWHWEVAVKFYLGAGDTRQPCNWHGPGLNDRLDRKLAHLLARQSVISLREPVEEWLKNRHIQIQRRLVILKGRLYYPFAAAQSQVSPQGSATGHESGWWLDEAQLRSLDNEPGEDESGNFMPLINQGWLAKVSTSSKSKYCSIGQLFKTVSNGDFRLPLHLQLSRPLLNKEKIFLVDKGWTESLS